MFKDLMKSGIMQPID